MKRQNLTYCKSCADSILGKWKGWPHKDVIPLLPKSIDGICEECGSNETLDSSEIIWLNYHSEYSTGLPDYWLLVIRSKSNKWGLPYYSEGQCPRCNSRTILSEMNYPNGKHELKHNCKKCGVVKADC